jgi:hypothetical protein
MLSTQVPRSFADRMPIGCRRQQKGCGEAVEHDAGRGSVPFDRFAKIADRGGTDEAPVLHGQGPVEAQIGAHLGQDFGACLGRRHDADRIARQARKTEDDDAQTEHRQQSLHQSLQQITRRHRPVPSYLICTVFRFI